MPNPAVSSGVFPCYTNQFQVANGPASQAPSFVNIADMETYSVAFENGIEEWHSYGEEGWIKRLMTAKGVKISVKGKRCVGDAGNDVIAGMAMENGTKAQKTIKWTFPDGDAVLFENAVINVTALNADDSVKVGPLEFEILSNGKPTYTPAA